MAVVQNFLLNPRQAFPTVFGTITIIEYMPSCRVGEVLANLTHDRSTLLIAFMLLIPVLCKVVAVLCCAHYVAFWTQLFSFSQTMLQHHILTNGQWQPHKPYPSVVYPALTAHTGNDKHCTDHK